MSALVAFWNLENLFAPEGHPGREAWLAKALQKELKGWSEALFRRKIAQLASIIGRMKDGAGPEILGVCEVENRYALQALADQLNAALPARNYQLVHVDSGRDQRGIDTAFLFDAKQFTAKMDELFSHWVMRQTGTRDITQITFVAPSGKALVMLANHWPSRSSAVGNGPEYSSGFRATAGETLAYWHDRIRQEKGDKVAVIALGDFNDEPFDKSVALHAQALRDKGDVTRARSAKFYNLSWEYLTAMVADHKGNARLLNGTLYFAGDAALFDQILVSPGLLTGKSGWRTVDGSARIEAYPPMVSHRVGEGPIRFGLPDGDAAANVNVDGYSDHFPVSVRIEEV
ncbi:MAG: endonuclease [Gammaproteobacteria bacterium]|nr:endonuclease [Gammaproteobacteria bacterium]MBU1600714.1 endonuclease [Gammaproteobacteria bacterium]MBU2435170.1 endonuclease [Gammaproteobacteria bacterium]MBU2448584.1 endonuclease [Gammaproteobacteria bacterium]